MKLNDVIKIYFKIPVCFGVIAILVFLLQELFGKDFSIFGIYPRSFDGILGIFLSPFIHGSWNHLISNLFSITFLLFILYFFYERVATSVLSLIWLSCGFLVWLFGKGNTFHIGSSGVIYGIIGFVFFSGIFRGNNRSIILSLIVLIFNGGFLAGFVPKQGISWESHFWGMVIGMVLSFILKNVTENEEKESFSLQVEKEKYFSSDTFIKTKLQRAIEEEQKRLEEDRQKIIELEMKNKKEE